MLLARAFRRGYVSRKSSASQRNWGGEQSVEGVLEHIGCSILGGHFNVGTKNASPRAADDQQSEHVKRPPKQEREDRSAAVLWW
jgi:hypothetical protein